MSAFSCDFATVSRPCRVRDRIPATVWGRRFGLMPDRAACLYYLFSARLWKVASRPVLPSRPLCPPQKARLELQNSGIIPARPKKTSDTRFAGRQAKTVRRRPIRSPRRRQWTRGREEEETNKSKLSHPPGTNQQGPAKQETRGGKNMHKFKTKRRGRTADDEITGSLVKRAQRRQQGPHPKQTKSKKKSRNQQGKAPQD